MFLFCLSNSFVYLLYFCPLDILFLFLIEFLFFLISDKSALLY